MPGPKPAETMQKPSEGSLPSSVSVIGSNGKLREIPITPIIVQTPPESPVNSFLGKLTTIVHFYSNGIPLEIADPVTQTSDGTLKDFHIANTGSGRESIAVTRSDGRGDDAGSTDDPGTD